MRWNGSGIAMTRLSNTLNAQAHVNEYFETNATQWNDLYADGNVDVWSRVHCDRHMLALSWVDSLMLPDGARVLEVGCGAGLLSVDLARRSLRVTAIDPVEAMVVRARQRAEQTGVPLSVMLGDANALAFADDTFDVVVALGVLPWLEDPQKALREMARVTQPGGYVLVTADNRARLHSFFDPWLNPGTAWLKRVAKVALASGGLYRPSGRSLGAQLHSRKYTDAALRNAGLTKLRGATVGFGPFTVFRHPVLPAKSSVDLHLRLQHLADQQAPVLRATGSQYVVLAHKPRKAIDDHRV
jgi:ubiquinone/menaquinone biosynthesis C-methylase UbiE